jgi:hypothetical protein
MNKTLSIIAVLISISIFTCGQEIIFKESFGNDSPGIIIQSNYIHYDNPDLFNIDSIEVHIKKGGNFSTGYAEASGNSFVQMDGHFNWDGITPLSDTLLISSIDTRGFTDIYLSFGIFNRTGWSGISDHAFDAFFSDDNGQTWIKIDKTNTINGNHFPGNNIWGWVTLGESLPSIENLAILIVNPEENVHTCLLDDIMLTGFLPDDELPTTPANLEFYNVSINSVDLLWSASDDNRGISHYIVNKNGRYLTNTPYPYIQIKYQTAGSKADFSIVACDIAGNHSSESDVVTIQFKNKPAEYSYSWQKAHAKVLPEGDLDWQPDSFKFEPGISMRYIDYEEGDDNQDGLTRETAWKHHPWDNKAVGNAADCSGIHTYVFKRGVIYRGKLIARESGTVAEPIRLTSDPTWGSDEAYLFGSIRISDGWKQADESSAPNIPDPEKVWYQDISLSNTKYICEFSGNDYVPIRPARSPNHAYTPEDPVKTWWKWTDKEIMDDGINIWLSDDNHLIQDDPEFYVGASVYSQEDAWVMCTVRFLEVLEWDHENNRLKMGHTKFGGKGCRYFIENTPFLLDTTSEFYYDKVLQRLFVRLENDKNPNSAVIEIAQKEQLIEIENKHHIEISGITLGLTTAETIRYAEADAKSAIRMTGVCSNITIKNNKFVYQNGGISLHNLGSDKDNSHDITVKDNEFQNIGDLSIVFSSGGKYLDDVCILRNKITNVGFRQLGRQWSSIPAIYGQLSFGEVAGNIIDYSWGNGIDIFWGKDKTSDRYVPFVRGLIHHNKAINTVFGTNDYGGIESWQGGPTYCYNNRSHNSPGFRHYDNTSLGYAFYFDGCFKHYVFNNVASGVSHNRTATSFMQVLGYYNTFVHNTGYNTRNMFDGAPGGLNGHNTYLSNIAEDIEVFFWHKVPPEYIPFDSYGYNITSKKQFKASLEDKNEYYNLKSYTDKLESYKSMLTHTAWNAGKTVLSDSKNFDFRPRPEGEAIDRGVKFFASFPLAKVVGEWNFCKHPADISIIMANNLYLTEDFNNRDIYQYIPKNHLKVHNVTSDNYVNGELENWTEGALVFDGSSTYCSLDHAEVSAVKSNNVNMTTNDFIIETYLKTDTGHSNSTIVSKYDGITGYKLEVDESGKIKASLCENGNYAISVHSLVEINDGKWHHVLTEVLRNSEINIYVDGLLSTGSINGTMPNPDISLSNTADFLVGKDNDDRYFSGAMDFLRISKANLYEAKTTLDELYTWQTDGPFLYDMTGNAPIGKRDAGAIEKGEKLCELSITPSYLEFDEIASSQNLKINAAHGFELLTPASNIYTTDIKEDTIGVYIEANESSFELYDTVSIFGCHETRYIPISQAAGPCEFSLEADELTIDHTRQTIKIGVNTNGIINISCSSPFAFERLDSTGDTIIVYFYENSSVIERFVYVEIEACDGIHTLTITQKGKNTSVGESSSAFPVIYPNPVTNNRIHIKLPDNIGEYTCSLSDRMGKILLHKKLFTPKSVLEFDTSPGIYILRITGNEIEYHVLLSVIK